MTPLCFRSSQRKDAAIFFLKKKKKIVFSKKRVRAVYRTRNQIDVA